MSTPRHIPKSQHGSVLITTLIFAAIIAIVLGSYLNLSLSGARFAYRNYDRQSAFQLAEAGAEEALYSFNKNVSGDTTAWSGWTRVGLTAHRHFTDFDLGGGRQADVLVYISQATAGSTSKPRVLAQASISAPGNPTATRTIEVKLSRRSLFASGLVARDSIVFYGTNTSVDSWDSDPDRDASTAAIDYSSSTQNDQGVVATNSFENGAALINQADILGYVYTGGAMPVVGNNGSVRGFDTPADVSVDTSRIATDFNSSLPSSAAPVGGTVIASIGPGVLGVTGLATSWRSPSIVLKGNDTLTIAGDVTLVLTAASGDRAISVTGNAGIVIPKGSSLTIYCEGDTLISGNGITNLNTSPASLQLWGTNTSEAGQSLHIAGNGTLRAAVYAPEGDVFINGNGDVMGAVVARTIKLTGNAAFHYDEALRYLDTNTPYGVDSWKEVTSPAQKAEAAGILSALTD